MRTVRTVAELREAAAPARDAASGLVPTMGFLHEGHLSLIRRARTECATVVVSLFVNPKQFGPGEDLDAYPRDEERDAALAEEAGADILFAPPGDEVYPPGFATTVEVAGLTDVMCGAARPGHFAGVTTVVAKLFNMVEPDVAYFGQKDAQQALVIRKLVARPRHARSGRDLPDRARAGRARDELAQRVPLTRRARARPWPEPRPARRGGRVAAARGADDVLAAAREQLEKQASSPSTSSSGRRRTSHRSSA